VLDLGPGNDSCQTSFPAEENFRLEVLGGEGDDAISISSPAFVRVDGGPGNDLIGDSIGMFSQPTGAEFVGGPERDTLRTRFPPANLGEDDPAPSQSYLPWGVENALIINDDVDGIQIFGNSLDNRIELTGGAGRLASIYGRAGNDTLIGGDGENRLEGGGGHDSLLGSEDNDSMLGGDGDDRLFGGQGQDVLRGGEGNDFIDGGPGNDRLYGEGGNDTIFANRGRNRVYGGDGDDVIFARDGRRDTLYGGPGNDSAEIDDGPDVFDLVGEIGQIL
jgi:Ca2+-binding RTX toxin-like protein